MTKPAAGPASRLAGSDTSGTPPNTVDQERGHGDLGGQGDRRRLAHDRPGRAGGASRRAGQGHDPGRGRHGQGEADGVDQDRVDQQQAGDGEGQDPRPAQPPGPRRRRRRPRRPWPWPAGPRARSGSAGRRRRGPASDGDEPGGQAEAAQPERRPRPARRPRSDRTPPRGGSAPRLGSRRWSPADWARSSPKRIPVSSAVASGAQGLPRPGPRLGAGRWPAGSPGPPGPTGPTSSTTQAAGDVAHRQVRVGR